MFRIALAWAQLSTGMGFHLRDHPGLSAPCLECKWLASMRWGLAKNEGSIKCTELFLVPRARVGDVYLMDTICNCRRFTDGQIKKINACRLYLQVLLLSDIETPCAANSWLQTSILESAINGRTGHGFTTHDNGN